MCSQVAGIPPTWDQTAGWVSPFQVLEGIASRTRKARTGLGFSLWGWPWGAWVFSTVDLGVGGHPLRLWCPHFLN